MNDDVKRALDALNNGPTEMPDHVFLSLNALRHLGYEGNGKPGDVIVFRGIFTVHIIDDTEDEDAPF